MTKKDYELIAEPFAKKTNWTQYLYCTQGFNDYGTPEQTHTERGIEFYIYFKSLDTIVFGIANNLADQNSKFDRNKFFKACGMQTDGIRRYSFIPTSEMIRTVRS